MNLMDSCSRRTRVAVPTQDFKCHRMKAEVMHSSLVSRCHPFRCQTSACSPLSLSPSSEIPYDVSKSARRLRFAIFCRKSRLRLKPIGIFPPLRLLQKFGPILRIDCSVVSTPLPDVVELIRVVTSHQIYRLRELVDCAIQNRRISLSVARIVCRTV